MIATDILNTVVKGDLIECTKEEYPAVRSLLQDFAGTKIDQGDHVRAIIALEEVKRLDKLYPHE